MYQAMSNLEPPATWPPFAPTAPERPHSHVEEAIADLATKTSRTASRWGLASRDLVDLIKPFGFALRNLDHGDVSGAGRSILAFIHLIALRASESIREAESVALITAAERIRSQLARLESPASTPQLLPA